jgi:hypothetical protein
MKRTVVHNSAPTGNCLILAKERSQHFKGDTTVAWRPLVQMKYKEIYVRKCTRDNRSVLPLRSKRPLLVPVLAVLASNGVRRSNNSKSHVKCLIFLSDINPIWIFSTGFNKISQYKISQKSVHWETSCFTQTCQLTARHDETNSSFLRESANAPKIFDGCILRCSYGD